MKDTDNQYLFESYLQSIEEGRKKQFKDRVRKTVKDPITGEDRNESYYEMMQRLKGRGSGPRTRETRQRKEKTSSKVKLSGRIFKPGDKAYEIPLRGVQRDIINFVENSPAKAKEIIDFASEYVDKTMATSVVEDMVLTGLLDEVFNNDDSNQEPPVPEKPVNIDDIDPNFDQEDDLADY